MEVFDDFEEVVCVFRCPEFVRVSSDTNRVVAEVVVPFIPGKELCARVLLWAYSEKGAAPDSKHNYEVVVYRNEFIRRVWNVWRTEPEGHSTVFHVNPGNKISVVASNGRRAGLVLSGIEIGIYAKDEGA